jgi:hypothetical protein
MREPTREHCFAAWLPYMRCPLLRDSDQLFYDVQPSVAGLVVAVAAPPVAATPVREAIEKYVEAHTASEEVPIVASLASVTTNVPGVAPTWASTVKGVVSVCGEPTVAVERVHATKLVAAVQPALGVVSELFV